jgi:ABC-type antimicrobial peptide transport system permease subunit
MSGFIELKIALRNLIKNPLRTIFTLIAITLGVSLFFSVSIATDSLENSLRTHLGENEFIQVENWIFLFRGILTFLSAISLIICVIIIKNLMEMSKESSLYEIGLLRAIGNSKRSIFLIYFYQILIISLIGMILGLFLGYFLSYLFFDPLREIMNTFYSLDDTFGVKLHFSEFTLMSGIFAGLLIPLVFGIIPAISAARTNVLSALNPHARPPKQKLKQITALVFKLVFSMSLLIGGIVFMNIGFGELLTFYNDPTMESAASFGSIFLAGLCFIGGIILLSAIFLPYFFYLLSQIYTPILLKIKKIAFRSLVKDARRTRNTFLMIAIGLSFFIMINVTVDSVKAGVLPGARMRLGGDLQLGYFSGGSQLSIPLNTSVNVTQIAHVTDVCEVKNSDWRSGYALCDTYGGGENEVVLIVVINTTSYVNLHSSESIYKYEGEESLYDFIHQLDANGTVLLQRGLSETIEKSEEESVDISTSPSIFFPTFTSNLKVKGIFDRLPGMFFSWSDEVWWDKNLIGYTAVISWNTYFDITNTNYSSTTGYFWVDIDDYTKAKDVKDDVISLYQTLGAPWNITYLGSSWEYRTVLQEIGEINEILSLVFVIIVSILYIGIFISMLGLSTSMIMSVNQKRRELGILRSVGTSKKQVLQIIFGETLVISTTALFIGIITGLITAFLISNVPFMPYAPFIFTISWDYITLISFMMIGLSLFVSILPAIKAGRLNITESIRKRGI